VAGHAPLAEAVGLSDPCLCHADTGVYAPSQIPVPPLARFLFADTCMAWLWLIVRLYAAYQWLVAGLEK
jgi:thiosulfate dehydrogenase [quinone] large subunit